MISRPKKCLKPCAALLAIISGLFFAQNSFAQIPGLIEAAASENYFSIEPGFNGTSIVLFGSVDQDKIKGDMPDIAITLFGPTKPVTVWSKERRVGIWMNSRGFTLDAVPTFYATLTSRPLEDIAPIEERKRFQIGFDALSFSGVENRSTSNEKVLAPVYVQNALLRLKRANETFVQDTDAIQWLGKRLFRARVNLPAAAGPGLYRAHIFVLHTRKVIGETTSQVTLQKVGIEHFLSSTAENQPWLYGSGAVLVAASIGFGASLVLRRQ